METSEFSFWLTVRQLLMAATAVLLVYSRLRESIPEDFKNLFQFHISWRKQHHGMVEQISHFWYRPWTVFFLNHCLNKFFCLLTATIVIKPPNNEVVIFLSNVQAVVSSPSYRTLEQSNSASFNNRLVQEGFANVIASSLLCKIVFSSEYKVVNARRDSMGWNINKSTTD